MIQAGHKFSLKTKGFFSAEGVRCPFLFFALALLRVEATATWGGSTSEARAPGCAGADRKASIHPGLRFLFFLPLKNKFLKKTKREQTVSRPGALPLVSKANEAVATSRRTPLYRAKGRVSTGV